MKKNELIDDVLKIKNYDELFEKFGKRIYLKYTPKEYQIKDIQTLFENKRYDIIYSKYGRTSKIYVKNLSKLKRQDIKNLLKEGKFEDIRLKYGDREYNKHLKFMNKQDVQMETGKRKKYKLRRTKKRLAILATSAALVTQATIAAQPVIELVGINLYNQNVTRENVEKYHLKMEAYDEYLKNYALEVKEMELDDLQTIMKVINDIWKNTEYGDPWYDIFGCFGLDVYKKGPSVCRNIVDDFVRKMNYIDPKFNAKRIEVKVTQSDMNRLNMSNVEMYASTREYRDLAADRVLEYIPDDVAAAIDKIGNHVIAMINLSDGSTICVDPTNPSIGIINDDKIEMLSSNVSMQYSNYGTIYLYPIDGAIQYNFEAIKRHFDSHGKNYYEQKYGWYAQNQALKYVKELENKKVK